MKTKEEIEQAAEIAYKISGEYPFDSLAEISRQAFIRGAEFTNPKWIKCSERLPELSDADENGKILLFRVTNNDQKSISKTVHDWNMVKHCDRENTFWMPLPQMPEL